jgi:predicted Fe-Mo cluster-binding NifX family protein
MRIAISLQTNAGLDSVVANHFGRCPFFALVDMEDNEVQGIEIIANPYHAAHQPGQVPQLIRGYKADVMLSGGMGGRAIRSFGQFGIEAATGAEGTVRTTLEKYLGGQLSEAAPCAESTAHGHGQDR